MAEFIQMLALSPTMETGTIAHWNKKEGDKIESGDVICEVETDKATMDYESTQEGTLLKILVEKGGDAAIGDPIGIIGEEGEDISDLIEEGKKQFKQGAEKEKKAEKKETAEEETKEEPEEVSEKEKKEKKKKQPEKVEIKLHKKDFNIPDPVQTSQWPGTIQAKPEKGKKDIKVSPLARKIAGENGLKLSGIKGTGPAGRIVKEDVEKALERKEKGGAPMEAGPGMVAGEVPLSAMRKTIARRMSESKFNAPHYYLRTSVRMDEIMMARHELNQRFDEKLSFNSFIIKFVSQALKKFPKVNSSWQGDHIKQFGTIDIGLAVALDDGLVAPVVRNCQNKGIIEINQDMKELVEKARNGELSNEEYSNATFTISNLGMFDIEEFTAIINPPGSAILALGQIKRELVPGDEDDEILLEHRMRMTMSCDHRVIDGAEGAAFLHRLKEMMEDPVKALL
ncbi:MAG: pyruvate dehydrogenase complex dihydrolipoamide acetyltransferase [Vulcanimicrobiota bacterium]